MVLEQQLQTITRNATTFAGVEVETGSGNREYMNFHPMHWFFQTGKPANITDAVIRGKVCWISLRLDYLGSGMMAQNSTGGYGSPAGRKIRIFNVFL